MSPGSRYRPGPTASSVADSEPLSYPSSNSDPTPSSAGAVPAAAGVAHHRGGLAGGIHPGPISTSASAAGSPANAATAAAGASTSSIGGSPATPVGLGNKSLSGSRSSIDWSSPTATRSTAPPSQPPHSFAVWGTAAHGQVPQVPQLPHLTRTLSSGTSLPPVPSHLQQPSATGTGIDPLFEAHDLRNYSLSLQTPSVSAAVSFGSGSGAFKGLPPVVTPVSTSAGQAANVPATSGSASSPLSGGDLLGGNRSRPGTGGEGSPGAGTLSGRRAESLSLGSLGRTRFSQGPYQQSPSGLAFGTPAEVIGGGLDTPSLSTPSSTSSYSSSGLFSPLPTPGLSQNAHFPFVSSAHPSTSSSPFKPLVNHKPHFNHLVLHGDENARPPAAHHSRGTSRGRHLHGRLASQPYFHHQDPGPSNPSLNGSGSGGAGSAGVGMPGGGGLASPAAVGGPGGLASAGMGPGTSSAREGANGSARSERGVGPAGEREREREGVNMNGGTPVRSGLRRPSLSAHRLPSAPPYTMNTLKREREELGMAGPIGGPPLTSIGEASFARDGSYFAAGPPNAATLNHHASLPHLATQQPYNVPLSAPASAYPHSGSSSGFGSGPPIAPAKGTATEVSLEDLDTLYVSLRDALLEGRKHAAVESTKALGRKVEEMIEGRKGELETDEIARGSRKRNLSAMEVDGGQAHKATQLEGGNSLPGSSNMSRRSSNAVHHPPVGPPAPPPLYHSQSTPVVPMQHQFTMNGAVQDPIMAHSTFATPAANAQAAGIHLPAHALVQPGYSSFGVPSGVMGMPPSIASAPNAPMPQQAQVPQQFGAHLRQTSSGGAAIIHSTPPSPGAFRAQYDGPIVSGLGVSVPAPLQHTHAGIIPPGALNMAGRDEAATAIEAFPGLPSGPRSRAPSSAAQKHLLSKISLESLRDPQGQGSAFPSPITNDSSDLGRSRRNTQDSHPPSRAISDDGMDEGSPPSFGLGHGSASAAAVAAANAQATAGDFPSRGTGSQMGAATAGVPPELAEKLDPIFYGWLGMLCSDLDMTDSKGEPIHQTLMAKKMQRLEESTDFRPFKFRIQAFTNGLYEELMRRGFNENDLPLKKVRQYLWSQTCISRFNEEGKKAKSKGNHVWHIEAKKVASGHWEFMHFSRKIVGRPAKVAYCGIKWVWAPRVWDPQCSVQNIKAVFSSPTLPSWLTWKDNVLSGVPPLDAANTDVTAHAVYTQNGRKQQLEYSFQLLVTQIDGIDHAKKAELDAFSFAHSAVPSADSSARSTPRQSPEPGLSASDTRAMPLPALQKLQAAGLMRTESGNHVVTAGAPDLNLGPHEVKHEMLDPTSSVVGMPMLASSSLAIPDATVASMEPSLPAAVMPAPAVPAVPAVPDMSMVPVGLAQQNAILEANMQAQNMAAAMHDAQVNSIRSDLLSGDSNVSAGAQNLLSQALASQDPAHHQLAADVLAPLSTIQEQPQIELAAAMSAQPAFAMEQTLPSSHNPVAAMSGTLHFSQMAVDQALLADPAGSMAHTQPAAPDLGMAMDFEIPPPHATGVVPGQGIPSSLVGDLSRPSSQGGPNHS